MDFTSVFVGFVLGAGATTAWNWSVKSAALSVVNRAKNERGRAAQLEYSDDLMTLLYEVKQAHDEWKAAGGTENLDFAKKHLVGIGLRHPQTVKRYGKRLYQLFKTGDFANFEGLME